MTGSNACWHVKNKPCVFLDQTLKVIVRRLRRETTVLTIKIVDPKGIDLYPVPPKHFDAQFGDDIRNEEEQNDEERGADDVDAQEQPNLDEDIHPVQFASAYATNCSTSERSTRDSPHFQHSILQMKAMKMHTRKNARFYVFSDEMKSHCNEKIPLIATEVPKARELFEKQMGNQYGTYLKGFTVKGKKTTCARLQESMYGFEASTEDSGNKKVLSRALLDGKQGLPKTFSDSLRWFSFKVRFLSKILEKHWHEAVKCDIVVIICEGSACFMAIKIAKVCGLVYHRG
ncbi:hypothetical protein Tco_1459240 [Tanacetum coccineum]